MPKSEWVGLNRIKQNFRRFDFTGPKVQTEFLDFIGQQTVQLLRNNTPKDTGTLANSWRVTGKGRDFVDVGTDDSALVGLITQGTQPHIIEPSNVNALRFEVGGQEIFTARVHHPGTQRNPFLDGVNTVISGLIISTLEASLANKHPYFKSLKGVGGKGRKFQQVGRVSAGFEGGTSFAGRATLKRAGTGKKSLTRKLILRRRKGRSLKSLQRELKTKVG